MKKYITTLSLILISAAAFATDAGRTALPFLKMDMGARYYGMAGAATAFGDDLTAAAFYNPAALGKVQGLQLSASTFEDKLDMKAQQAAIATPIPFLSFFGSSPLNISVNAYLYDLGDIEEAGRNRDIGKDMSLQVTLAEHMLTHGWDLGSSSAEVSHYAGITAKYLKSSLPLPTDGKAKADTFAFDAGYQFVIDNHFGFGAAVKNLGPGIKYDKVKNDLPSTASAGLFYTFVDLEGVRWDVSGDYIYYLREKEDRVRLGTEAVFMDMLSVRGGVRFMEEIDTEYTLGFGLKLFGFEVDFGTILNPQLNDDKMYQVSVAYKFPVKKGDKPRKGIEKRDNYKEYQEKKTKKAEDSAIRNRNPIVYQ